MSILPRNCHDIWQSQTRVPVYWPCSTHVTTLFTYQLSIISQPTNTLKCKWQPDDLAFGHLVYFHVILHNEMTVTRFLFWFEQQNIELTCNFINGSKDFFNVNKTRAVKFLKRISNDFTCEKLNIHDSWIMSIKNNSVREYCVSKFLHSKCFHGNWRFIYVVDKIFLMLMTSYRHSIKVYKLMWSVESVILRFEEILDLKQHSFESVCLIWIFVRFNEFQPTIRFNWNIREIGSWQRKNDYCAIFL